MLLPNSHGFEKPIDPNSLLSILYSGHLSIMVCLIVLFTNVFFIGSGNRETDETFSFSLTQSPKSRMILRYSGYFSEKLGS